MDADLEFTKRADACMNEILEALEDIDPDELDCQLAMGVLSMEFADGSKGILNRQSAAQQIWLALGATAWHFANESGSREWLDTKGRGELRRILAAALGERLGRKVSL